MNKDIKKVLTLRASSIGDALMGKYFLENVHVAFPAAKCYMLVGSRLPMIRDLFHAYPWLTVLEANRWSPAHVMLAYHELALVDVTLTQESERPFSLPSKLFSRAVTRRGGLLGFNDGWWGNKLLYDAVVSWDGEEKSGGIILEEQKALTTAGIPIGVKEFTLAHENDTRALKKFGVEEKKYILLHLFAGSSGREISQEKRLALLAELRKKLPPEYKLLLTGGKGEERRKTDEVAARVQGVKSIAGETSMKDFINLITHSAVTVSLNTGASHIAAHTKTPVVVLSQQGGKEAWWSGAMYGGVPTVLCNESADDTAPRDVVWPPSMENIANSDIVQVVLSRIV